MSGKRTPGAQNGLKIDLWQNIFASFKKSLNAFLQFVLIFLSKMVRKWLFHVKVWLFFIFKDLKKKNCKDPTRSFLF